MKTETSAAPEQKQIFLKDYQKPNFEISKTELWFELDEKKTIVRSQLKMRRVVGPTPLRLNGESILLRSVSMDGRKLDAVEYKVDQKFLIIDSTPNDFLLEIEVELDPSANTQLSGLYFSKGLLTTQCEAEGFRRITYYPDRPDVMTIFTVHIRGDKKKYPILLSNGNKKSARDLEGGLHEVTFEDPFKKAAYLFALVAGDLAVLNDHFITVSGKKIALEIYAEKSVIDRCHHAMESLKRSFEWDEVRFGREYDLETFMIVAISDFNSGAMENKGLNIFNARLILADPRIATDRDYFRIESVIGHEYFHNWTGNRVTLRDWFHLSLKEGLTVFRDQEFSADLHSPSAVRIESVEELRDQQFAEDAGPNAHPIRPESCYAVDNFYTSTIYEKGAEVIRMMQTLVGRPGFRKGMDLYFERFDGQAVIIEDFAQAIAEANKIDFEQFRLWYSQAGTPTVKVRTQYDEATKNLTVTFDQACPKTFRENEDPSFVKRPFHIPLEIALFDAAKGEIPLQSEQIRKNSENQTLFELRKFSETLTLQNVPRAPVLSVNRGFSAPIKVDQPLSINDLFVLLENETNPFSQWEASQRIYENLLLNRKQATDRQPTIERLGGVLATMIKDEKTDISSLTKILSLPSDSWLAQNDAIFDSQFYISSRRSLMTELATFLRAEFFATLTHFAETPATWNQANMSAREFKNIALHFLSYLGEPEADLAWQQFQSTNLMTDQQASFETLVEVDHYRDGVIRGFHERWKSEALVLNKWFSVQALANHAATFSTVEKLWSHPDFDPKNPNRVYSLLRAFGTNLTQFHVDQNKNPTYQWAAEKIVEIDGLNPHVAARVSSMFNFCKNVEPNLKSVAILALKDALTQKLSPNTYEILSTTYKDLTS